MLTLYHAAPSRSSRLIRLIDEMGIRDRVDIRIVDIPRQDGAGRRDPANPHPEGKVPFLVHDGVPIRETNAIILYLTELFPEAGLGPVVGDPQRGRYLAWLAWYGNVMEPVFIHQAAGLAHPILAATFRGLPELHARLAEALEGQDYILGDRYTAADLLLASPFEWFPQSVPQDIPAIRDWVARCLDRPSTEVLARFDAEARLKLSA